MHGKPCPPLKFYLTSVPALQPFTVVLTVQRSDCSRLLALSEPCTGLPALPPTDATSGCHCQPCSGGEVAGKVQKQGQGWRPEPRSGSGSKCLETECGWEESSIWGQPAAQSLSPDSAPCLLAHLVPCILQTPLLAHDRARGLPGRAPGGEWDWGTVAGLGL